MKEQPKSQDPRTVCTLNDVELLQACHKAITDMCQKQRWQMTVPPDMSRDSDILLSELCTRFSRVSGEPPKPDQDGDKIAELVKGEYEKGNIVIATEDGLGTTRLEDFLNQPVDGILYDLNRGEETVLTFINDPKWVNDYAVAKVIRALMAKIEKVSGEAKTLELWISVKDGLPKGEDVWRSANVLIYNENYDTTSIGYYWIRGGHWSDGISENITHWQPLTKPRKK